MTRAMSAGLILKKNALDPQSPWVALWDVEASPTQTLHLVNHPRNIVYLGAEYRAYPIRHEEIREDASGGLQKLTVHVPNVFREVQAFLEFNDGMRGRRATLIVVNLDDLTLGDWRSSFIIEAATAGQEVASFVMGKAIPVTEVRAPVRLFTRDLFPSLPSA